MTIIYPRATYTKRQEWGMDVIFIKPVFGSSFIQSWYCERWDLIRWNQELTMIKDAGINEVILQCIIDNSLTSKYAYYQSSIVGFTSNSVDILENALVAADHIGMKIRVGTGYNSDWWSKCANDVTWLITESNFNKAVVAEVTAKYSKHVSFCGWYIPYEVSNLTSTSFTKQRRLNNFFKSIATEMKLRTPALTVMVSPWYNSKYSLIASLSNWSTAVQNIFRGTGVDILALQDSVGTGYNKTNQLAKIYSYTKKGTDLIGVKLYANAETFTSTSCGNIASSQTRTSKQLAEAKPYVNGYVAFSVNHYQTMYSTDISKVQGYSDYLDYYLTHK